MVRVRVDGIMVVAGVGLAAAYYVYSNRQKIKDFVAKDLNPASQENLVFEGTQAVVGEENLQDAADYFFGAIDLINPFAPDYRKRYAREVYGMDNNEQR